MTSSDFDGPTLPGFGSNSAPISGTWEDITAQEVEQLRDGQFYVNVHTAQNAPGEIRGQLE